MRLPQLSIQLVEDLDTVLLERVVGGLAATTSLIDNYPGFADGIEGMKLAEQLEAPAKRFGADIRYGEVTRIVDAGNHKEIEKIERSWTAP